MPGGGPLALLRRRAILSAVGRKSAGLLLYRFRDDALQVLLVHPGGPFWIRRDAGAWTVPKGEYEPTEEPLAAALREFEEELGCRPDACEWIELAPIRQRGGKLVTAFAGQADFDASRLVSNTFSMEWPPRSGQMREFPEVDRAQWYAIAEARQKILASQVPLLDELERRATPGGRED